jgi:HEPN domain-containing protein
MRKAEHDLRAVRLLLRHRDAPADAVCFHAQQGAEKALKAVLAAQGIEPERTHDLLRLLEAVEPFIPSLGAEDDALAELTEHAVRGRYPGYRATPTLRHAERSARVANEVYRVVQRHLQKAQRARSNRKGGENA